MAEGQMTLSTYQEIDACPGRITTEEATRAAADLKQVAALAELIDSGAKNMMPTPDGTNPAGQSWFRQDIELPPGEYVVFFQTYATTDTDSTQCRIGFFDANGNAAGSYKYINVDDSHSVTNAYVIYTLTESCTNVRFYPSQTVTLSQGDTVTFTGCMICSKAAWDISQKFVPYCPPLAELYAMIQNA